MIDKQAGFVEQPANQVTTKIKWRDFI